MISPLFFFSLFADIQNRKIEKIRRKNKNMGEIRRYFCSCGYEKKLFTGAGLQGMNQNAIARYFAEDIVRSFKERQKNGEIRSYLMENAIICCQDCRELYTVPYFHYETEDGRKRHYLTVCPVCKKPASDMVNPAAVLCPQCGCKMDFESAGNWD